MINSITLGAGCFWCVEAIFSTITGVIDIDVGYSNGLIDNPTYKIVCNGESGYAEVAKISFDETIVSLEEILDVFFTTHDPTTLNQQGADIGSQYRSAIFYNSNKQKETAEELLKKWNNDGIYRSPIVTEITKLDRYYPAEDYHQEYYKNNKNAPYCKIVIKPKLDKLNK